MTKYYAFNIISWSLLTATIIGLIVLYIAWHRRKSLTARYLFYLEVGVVLWTFAAIFEMAAKNSSIEIILDTGNLSWNCKCAHIVFSIGACFRKPYSISAKKVHCFIIYYTPILLFCSSHQ